MLHGAIYKKRKNAGAVFHGHCREILSYGRRMNIRETEKEEPYGTRRLVAGVLKILGKQKFLIMKNHGFVSLGRSMKTAGSLALAVREACREKFE
jgi:ribulose-5-phosphate 4-epimerase/fuculose-1-phosphate aldolase